MTTNESSTSTNFIQQAINADNESGRFDRRVHTRFPPEPNGYLHIGHAKSICLNFGLASEFDGLCNLRFDDTNPTKESVEYVESQKEDVRWLGFDWHDRELYASDYFGELYEFAKQLVLEGKAYVDDLSQDEIREYRGTLTQPGKESPYRNRSAEENLDLLECMKAGEFSDGAHVLRAKIDMASPNLNMRDPVMYRILHTEHHRTGDDWCIYPMYDFAHGQSDSIEGITHSICTMEYEDHRPLYDWFLQELGMYQPPPDRVCAPQPQPYGTQQASPATPRRRRLCERLGRPAHANHCGLPQAWLHAGSNPRLLRPHRCGKERRHHRHRAARTQPA